MQPKLRYFTVPAKPKFSWKGGKVPPPPNLRKVGSFPHFRGFTLGELSVEVGDIVIVKKDDSSEDLLSCDVARIEGLYEDDGEVEDPYRAVVTWLCRPKDLPKQLEKHGWEEQGAPPLDPRIDVVLEGRNFDTNISTESVYFKCNVFSQPISTQPEAFVKSCPESKYPNYILRFKMKCAGKGKSRKMFTLEPYRDGLTSPLKLTGLSPLKERRDKRSDLSRSPSPAIPVIPKLVIPENLGFILGKQLRVDLRNSAVGVQEKKRRRLSSAGGSRENTPLKRAKKSTSVNVSPDIDAVVTRTPIQRGTTTASTPPANSPEVNEADTLSGQNTGLNGGYWGTDSAKRTPKPAKKNGESTVETPKSTSRKQDGEEGPATPRSRVGRTPRTVKDETPSRQPVKRTGEKAGSKDAAGPDRRGRAESKKELEPRPKEKRRAAEEPKMFTEIVTHTGSGKKVKITCGGKNKFGPSSGLGNKAIESLLDSDEEFEPEKPSKSKPKPVQTTPSVQKRTRRASIAVVEKEKEKKNAQNQDPSRSETNRTKRLAMSETKPTDRRLNRTQSPKKSSARRLDIADRETQENLRKKGQAVLDKFSTRRKSSATTRRKTIDKRVTSSSSSDSDSDFEESTGVGKKSKNKEQSNGESSSEELSSCSDEEPAVNNKRKPASTQPKPVASTRDRRGFRPGVAQRVKPVSGSANPLVEAQARLHVSAVPDSLPCREDEFSEIFGYVEGKLQEGTGGCIYISGVPGTGKTATVKQVMRYMEENREEFPDFNFYELNGMRLTCPEQTYVEMWRLLSGEKLVHEQAMKKLDQRFATPAPRRVHTVFLVDELDMLCKKKQTVLYNIFEWPSRPQAKVIIIAIANTMDLPERDMDMRVISRLGFNRLHFEPYTQQQLQCIVSSRLEGLEVFQSDEIQLVSRKVAGLSGDARRALDICRILAERCEREGKQRVTQVDVLKVHQEMFCSPKMQFIRSCSKMEQFFLRAMVNDFYKTGVEETLLRNIYLRLEEICAAEGVEAPTLHAAVDVSARLSSQRLILSEDYRKGLGTKLRLNVGFEDINFALKPRTEDYK